MEARESMRTRATRDALTNIWNRASILAYLNESLEQFDLRGTAVSVLLCDIDHFKSCNDTHGPPGGRPGAATGGMRDCRMRFAPGITWAAMAVKSFLSY